MPDFRFSGTLDGVPSLLRPGDTRVGAALAAAPVFVAGRPITVGDAVSRSVAVITRTATGAVANWTAVVGSGQDGCMPADPTNADHFGRVLGVVAAGASSGRDVQIQAIGDLIGSTPHGLATEAVLYVGLNGALAATPPSGAVWRQIIGKASTDRSIVVALGEASQITNDADAMIGDDGFSVPATVSEIVAGQGEKKYVRSPDLTSALPSLLLSALDKLPQLPSDPANYPPQGGLFRNGDANGYSIVRIYPAV